MPDLDLNALKITDVKLPKHRTRGPRAENPFTTVVRDSYTQQTGKRIGRKLSTTPGDRVEYTRKDGSAATRVEPSPAQKVINLLRNAAAQENLGLRVDVENADDAGAFVYINFQARERRTRSSENTNA